MALFENLARTQVFCDYANEWIEMSECTCVDGTNQPCKYYKGFDIESMKVRCEYAEQLFKERLRRLPDRTQS